MGGNILVCIFIYLTFLENAFPNYCPFEIQSWHFRISLAAVSEDSSLAAERWAVPFPLQFCRSRGWMCPDLGPGVHKNDQILRAELMLCSHPRVLWGEAGTILIFSSITSLLLVFFLTCILKFFHAGAFWATLCDTNPRTNYWLIRITAFKCQ